MVQLTGYNYFCGVGEGRVGKGGQTSGIKRGMSFGSKLTTCGSISDV